MAETTHPDSRARVRAGHAPACGMLGAMTSPIEVVEKGRLLAFSFEDMLKYHGPGSPGGVAHSSRSSTRGTAAGSIGRPAGAGREIAAENGVRGPRAP